MPLQKTSVPVKFSGGVDTKTAEQLVVPGSFLRLDNCVRRKTGRIEKRNGYEELSSSTSSGSTIGTGELLDTFNNDLLLFEADRLYSYSSSSDIWIDRGEIAAVTVDSDPLVRNTYRQALPDIAYGGGYVVTVYEDSRTADTIRYSIYDDATDAVIVYDTQIAATAERPRVVALADNFLIGYRITGTSALGLATISYANPSQITVLTAVESGEFDSGPWDFISFNSRYALAVFNTNTSTETKYVPINRLGDVGNGANGMPIPISVSESCTNGVAVVADEENQFFYSVLGSTSQVIGIVVPYSLHTYFDGPSPISQSNIRNIVIGKESSGDATFFVEVGNPSTVATRKNQVIYSGTMRFLGGSVSFVTYAAFKRSVGLASKPFSYNDDFYVTVAFDSSLQSTYFVLRDNGFIVAKAAVGLGGGLSQSTSDTPSNLKTGVSSVAVDSSGRFIFAGRQKNRLRANEDAEIIADSVGIQKFAFTFGQNEFDTDTLGDNLHIAGGIMLGFDGVSATELNFHMYPEDLSSSQAGTGTLPTGTYYYQAVYEWQDARGQIHRSAPSVPLIVTVTGTSDDAVTITVPTLRLTNKVSPRADVNIVLYSGEVNDDTIMYRLASTANSTSSDTVTFTDSAPRSASFTFGEVLYTTGGVVESTAPPASKVVVNHKNRLFIGGLEDGNTIYYTREHVSGEGVCFSDALTFKVDPRGGPVTALGAMDDKLVIFKQDAIFTLVGDGPLDTGLQNDYGQPQLVSADLGCVDPRSVVIVPMGLMFKSDKGIYLLDRTLGVKYIGDRVEDYNSHEVTSAVVLEDTNEVRFTTADGPCLVYNYYFDQWSTFQNYSAASACRALNTYVHLKNDGTVRKENDSYNDAGARYSMSIETSWFSFGDLQGYQRIYYIMGLGDYLSDHHTRVKMAYDFEDAYSETVYFNVDNGLDISYYGDDATYGDSTVYGGSGASIYQWYLRPRRQKCQSIKLLIEDVDTISDAGSASFNFVGLTFMAGIKSQGPRTRGGQEIGRE